MTYQEAEWIVKEVQRLEDLWGKNLFREYNEVVPNDIYLSDLKKMDLDEVKKIIDEHYGVYSEGDIVIEDGGIPVLITYIDKFSAKTIHDIKYHVVYAYGGTRVINIDDIMSKCDHVDEFQKVADTIDGYY